MTEFRTKNFKSLARIDMRPKLMRVKVSSRPRVGWSKSKFVTAVKPQPHEERA